jgi:hypothetical protein
LDLAVRSGLLCVLMPTFRIEGSRRAYDLEDNNPHSSRSDWCKDRIQSIFKMSLLL